MELLESPTLTGSLVTLEPLSHDHVADLREAAGEGELWRAWYTSIPHSEYIPGDIENRSTSEML